MRSFTDNQGRSHELSVNHTSIKRVKSVLDVDLLTAVGGDMIERLATEPMLLVDVVYVLCKPRLDELGISDEQFGESMAGDAIDGATAALLGDLVDFFPQRQRAMLNKAIEKYHTLADKTMDLAATKLDDPRMEAKLLQKLERDLDQAIQDLDSDSSGTSSGSTPTSLQGSSA